MAKNKLKRRQHNPFGNKRRKSDAQVEKRNKIIMGVFISVIMVGSILGIFMSDNSNNQAELEYTNLLGETYNFAIGQNFYVLKKGEQEIKFYYHPYDLQNLINDTGKIDQFIQRNQLILLFDPEDKNIVYIDLARYELSNELLKNNKMIIGAKTENTTSYSAIPILSCENATQEMPFMYFKTSNESKISFDNNCLIMEGNEFDFLRYRDLILYTEYKVMP